MVDVMKNHRELWSLFELAFERDTSKKSKKYVNKNIRCNILGVGQKL